MKRQFGLIILGMVLFVPLIATAYLNKTYAADGFWADTALLTELTLPSEPFNTGNLECEFKDIASRYLVNETYVNGKLTYSDQTQERAGTTYPAVCLAQNKHGLVSSGYWVKHGLPLNKALPVSSNPYAMLPAPGGSAILFTAAHPQGGLQYSINHSLEYIGALAIRVFGSGVNAKKEKIWKIDTSKIEQFLTYDDASMVRISQIGFSSNGRYAAVQLHGRGFARLDVYTKELVPFSVNSYTTAADIFMSVSNDGRYVATARQRQLQIHDLAGCQNTYQFGSWPAAGALATTGCNSRDFSSPVLSTYPLTESMAGLRFSPNGASITGFARWRQGAAITRHFRLDASDYASTARGYLAMGDSFSSGEGDTRGGEWYEPGTDEQGNEATFEGRNLCHLSRRSYPYLLAVELGYMANNSTTPDADGLFHSVACSGARLHNITGLIGEKQNEGSATEFRVTDNQYRLQSKLLMELWQPGYTKQLGYLNKYKSGELFRNAFNPEVITLGIGGNDAGFGDKLSACLLPGTCEFAGSEAKRAGVVMELAQQKKRLVQTYAEVKQAAPEARIYAVGYPQFVAYPVQTCAANVHLDEAEVRFVHESIKYFNQVVRSAAEAAGVTYVDVEDVLSGANLCSGASNDTMAFNGATAGNDRGLPLGGAEGGLYSNGLCLVRYCIGAESFHPNQKGHQHYAAAIQRVTNGLSAANPSPANSPLPAPSDYFGVAATSFIEALNDPNSTTALQAQFKDMVVGATGYRIPNIVIDGLLPHSEVAIEIHSEPISLGIHNVNALGELETELALPEDLPAGYHELHVSGFDAVGNPVQYYQPLYVGAQAGDFDGDGVPDEIDSCPTIANSGIDADEDNIDDACDIEVIVQAQEPEDTEEEVALPDEEIETTEPEQDDLNDNQLEKGEISRETVAGDDELESGAVLGASTEGEVLAATGFALGVQAGMGLVLVLVTLFLGIVLPKNSELNRR